jgi:hypothetical protein
MPRTYRATTDLQRDLFYREFRCLPSASPNPDISRVPHAQTGTKHALNRE